MSIMKGARLRMLTRKTLRATAVALALTTPAMVFNGMTSVPAIAQAGPDAEVDFDTFYRELSPYGEWFEHARWGEIWRPNVPRDWRPYTRGHWSWTDEHGWYWVAEEEWGWAPFHYGRWVFDDDEDAWLWIPGYEWAPAWVQWRESEDFIGWAPLPPDSVLAGGSLRLNATFYDSPSYARYWVFAPPALMFLPGLYRHIVPTSRHSTIWRSTRHVPFHHRFDRGRVFMPGVDYRRVERWSGRSVPIVTLRAVDSPRRYGWRNMQDQRTVPVYRPRIAARPDVVRPQRPNIGTRGDRDRDGIPDWRDRRPNQPDVIVRPGPGGPRGDRDRDGIPDWRDPRVDQPGMVGRPFPGGPRGDRDRDGIPNARDPRPNQPDVIVRPGPGGPRGDRDRDGIPNARDPRQIQPDVIVRPGPGGPRGDRDRDGIPNARDPRQIQPDVVVRPGPGGPRGDRPDTAPSGGPRSSGVVQPTVRPPVPTAPPTPPTGLRRDGGGAAAGAAGGAPQGDAAGRRPPNANAADGGRRDGAAGGRRPEKSPDERPKQ